VDGNEEPGLTGEWRANIRKRVRDTEAYLCRSVGSEGDPTTKIEQSVFVNEYARRLRGQCLLGNIIALGQSGLTGLQGQHKLRTEIAAVDNATVGITAIPNRVE
jgi:hypothetical protein